ncbi:TRAP transporter substrate-binding protein [Martelella sp. FLE1502]
MITRRTLMKTGAAVAATLAAPNLARAQPMTVRLGHAANEIHPGHIASLEFKKSLDTLVPGAFDLQIFPNRQLGDDRQNVESCVAGTLEFCGGSGSTISIVTGQVALDAYQLPFLIRDYDHFARMALSPEGEAINESLMVGGILGLQTADIGQRHFATVSKPVRTLADFAGLKTRIVPLELHKVIWETVGVNPVGLPYGEVYGALETGTIDACEINVSSMLGENLWEVAKHFTLTGHYPWHNVTCVNAAFFESLSPELQEAVRTAGRDSVIPTLEYTAKQDLDGRAELEAKGVEILQLEGLDQMKSKVAPIVEQWSGKSPLIADFVSVAQQPS